MAEELVQLGVMTRSTKSLPKAVTKISRNYEKGSVGHTLGQEKTGLYNDLSSKQW